MLKTKRDKAIKLYPFITFKLYSFTWKPQLFVLKPDRLL